MGITRSCIQEYLVNGDFGTGDFTGWTLVDVSGGGSGTASFSIIDNVFVQEFTLPAQQGGIWQPVTLDTSLIYVLTFDAEKLSSKVNDNGLTIWLISYTDNKYLSISLEDHLGAASITISPSDWLPGTTDPLAVGVDSFNLYSEGDATLFSEYSITGISLTTVNGTVTIDSYIIHDSDVDSVNGSINIGNISDGSGTYTYLWDTGETTKNISGLAQGTYTLTITDTGNTCSFDVDFTVYTKCTLDFTQLKVLTFRIQCCLGQMVKRHMNNVKSGVRDICLEDKIKYTYSVLKIFLGIPGDLNYCDLTCAEINNYIQRINKFCTCDCCDGQETVKVHYNEDDNIFEII